MSAINRRDFLFGILKNSLTSLSGVEIADTIKAEFDKPYCFPFLESDETNYYDDEGQELTVYFDCKAYFSIQLWRKYKSSKDMADIVIKQVNDDVNNLEKIIRDISNNQTFIDADNIYKLDIQKIYTTRNTTAYDTIQDLESSALIEGIIEYNQIDL